MKYQFDSTIRQIIMHVIYTYLTDHDVVYTYLYFGSAILCALELENVHFWIKLFPQFNGKKIGRTKDHKTLGMVVGNSL